MLCASECTLQAYREDRAPCDKKFVYIVLYLSKDRTSWFEHEVQGSNCCNRMPFEAKIVSCLILRSISRALWKHTKHVWLRIPGVSCARSTIHVHSSLVPGEKKTQRPVPRGSDVFWFETSVARGNALHWCGQNVALDWLFTQKLR